MKLVTFSHDASTRIGLLDGENILDLRAAAPDLPDEMVAFLEAGDPALEAARAALGGSGSRIPAEEVHLESPILRPP